MEYMGTKVKVTLRVLLQMYDPVLASYTMYEWLDSKVYDSLQFHKNTLQLHKDRRAEHAGASISPIIPYTNSPISSSSRELQKKRKPKALLIESPPNQLQRW